MGGARRLGAAVVTALAVATALPLATACQSDPDRSSGRGTGIDLTGHTIEVAGAWSGVEEANFQAVLNVFTERTNASVRYTAGGDDLSTLLTSRLAGGQPPDVALIPQPGVIARFVAQGKLTELAGTTAAAVRANYSGAWQRLGTFDGRLYGVPFKAANKSVIWYRPDAFADAGVTPPTTWEEFLAVSGTLADAGYTPMAVPGADGWTLTDWFENVYLRIGGPDNYTKLARHEIPWTDPTVVRSLQLLRDYWRTPYTIQGGGPGAVQLKFTQSIADVFGAAPRSAQLFEGDFVAAEINKLEQVKVGVGASFYRWPSINGSPPAVVTAGDQAVAFKATPGALALIAFLASPEAATIMARRGGFLSPNQNLDPASYPDATTRSLADALARADVLQFDLSDQTPTAFGGSSSADMWVLLQDFLRNPAVDPADLARELEAAAAKDYGSI